MLDVMENKLLQIKFLAEQAKQENLNALEVKELNTKLNDLEAQIRALDGGIRRIEEY